MGNSLGLIVLVVCQRGSHPGGGYDRRDDLSLCVAPF